MIRLTANDTIISLEIPLGDPLHELVKSTVPGAYWNGKQTHWEFPPTSRVARHLREVLRGTKGRAVIDPDSGKRMTSLADDAPSDDLVLENGLPVLRIEFHPDYQAFARRFRGQLQDDGSWVFEENMAPELINYIQGSNLDIKVSRGVTQLAGKSFAPPKGYDGTLLSLHSIPVSVLGAAQRKTQAEARSKSKKKPKQAFLDRLSIMGINTLFDLINCMPVRYIDRSQPSRIADMELGQQATLIGKIISMDSYNPAKRMTRITVQDEEGKNLSVAFFNQRYINYSYRTGDNVILHGKWGSWTNRKGQTFKQLDSPTIDHLDSTRGARKVIPIYPQSEKLTITTWDILSLTDELLTRLSSATVAETLPAELIKKYGLIGKAEALKAIHSPGDMEEARQARRRMVYEELLGLQVFIQSKKSAVELSPGIAQEPVVGGLVEQFVTSLPYSFTGAQKRAQEAVLSDMGKPTPMHRLLQGDVGSGKSNLATVAVLNSVDSGHQAALMAPTEILAEQLYRGLTSDLEKVAAVSPRTGEELNIEFLGGKTTKKNKERITASLAAGEIDIVVGTHSLISKGVEFADLGVAVIDEQHRFGTEQRTVLRNARNDGLMPDMLVMTATPIPRTGAMVTYGDLDITIIDELPPGRVPIHTTWVKESGPELVQSITSYVWEDIVTEVQNGRQAYVVASLVEDNEKLAAQSTEDAFHALQAGALSGLRLGMVHGRQARKEREATMDAFAAGEIDVLVSTTVIEVGVNVPNSTVMVVLDAGKFGIAQLHQIRGRVGRSSLPSRCYLVSDTHTPDGVARLEALVESTDGFYLAEKDLEIRGEGALFGQRQSGESDLRVASLKDMGALTAARTDAEQIVSADPSLSNLPLLRDEVNSLFRDKHIQS